MGLQNQGGGVAEEGPAGEFYEEFVWSDLVSANTPKKLDLFPYSGFSRSRKLPEDQSPVVLPPQSVAFRQQPVLQAVARASDFLSIFSSMGALGKLHPPMTGPTSDLTTFYVDLLFLSGTGAAANAGDHRYVDSGGRPNSWAGGQRVVLGKDSVDFDCQVKQVHETARTAILVFNGVPPAKPGVKLPAGWMRAAVAGGPNNWAEVKKNNNGTCATAVGRETFEVTIKPSVANGQILSARMDNPVEALERQCAEANLGDPGAPVRYPIRRQIEIPKVYLY